jgi:colanic acid biosynthesis glycosyl transferase WcaI
MRFLILTQYFEPEIGAPQVRFKSFLSNLLKLGHQVEVVTALPNYPTGKIFPEYKGKFYSFETRNAVPVHRVWIFAALGGGVARILNYFSFALFSLYCIWKVNRPDYIFVESPPLSLGTVGWLYSKIFRCKVIFNVADLWPDSVRELGVVNNQVVLKIAYWLEDFIYRHSDYINSVTRQTIRTLHEKKNVPMHKLKFLPNGVDTEIFFPAEADPRVRNELGWEGKFVIIYAGTVGIAQGLLTLIKAVDELQRMAEFKNILLCIVGGGSEKNLLLKEVDKNGYKAVNFMDPMQPMQLVPLLQNADCGYVGLIDKELFLEVRPSKIFPKIASGLPIVFAGRGEAANIIRELDAGLVVPPEDTQALVLALMEMYRKIPEYKAKIAKAQKTIRTHYSWEYNTKQWLTSLEAVDGTDQSTSE